MKSLNSTGRPHYKWKNSSSDRRKRLISDAILGARVKTVFTTHSGCYGAKRITAELKDQADQAPVNHKRVVRVMRSLKLFGYTKKRKVTTTVSDKTKTFSAFLGTAVLAIGKQKGFSMERLEVLYLT